MLPSVDVLLCEYGTAPARSTRVGECTRENENRPAVPGFHTMLAVGRTQAECDIVLPVAEELSRHTGAQLDLNCLGGR